MTVRLWGSSSAGRAPRSQCGGQGFDPPLLHSKSGPPEKSGGPFRFLAARRGGLGALGALALLEGADALGDLAEARVDQVDLEELVERLAVAPLRLEEL